MTVTRDCETDYFSAGFFEFSLSPESETKKKSGCVWNLPLDLVEILQEDDSCTFHEDETKTTMTRA
jgi:hypothetical protein